MQPYQLLILAGTLAAAQYAIDPQNVPNATRAQWCQDQTASCPIICNQFTTGKPKTNNCDPNALQYQCICANGMTPNISEYSQTLPYYICQEWGNECVSNCDGAATCQSNCRSQHPCGAQNPTRVNTSTISATASTSKSVMILGATTTASDGSVATGLAGAAATVSTGTASQYRPGAIEFGRVWGTGIVLAGLFGAFAVLL